MKKGLIGTLLVSLSMGCFAVNITVEDPKILAQRKEINDHIQKSFDSDRFEKTKRKAEMGNISAQAELGSSYGLYKNDYTKANYWLDKAAKQGSGEAKYYLAQNYEQGWGVQKDIQKALQLYQESVNMGYLKANERIGFIYMTGKGVAKNEKLALDRLLIIADKDSSARLHVESLYCDKNFQLYDINNCKIWQKKTEESDKNIDNYFNSFKSHEDDAELGMVSAQVVVGSSYYTGKRYNSLLKDYEPFVQDYNKAAYWFSKAAAQGNDDAQANLAYMYSEGLGVRQDFYEATKLYTKAASQGNTEAQYNLALAYQQGKGVRQDYNQAFYWYQKSASQGNAYAQNNLGGLYLNGLGVRQNNTIAKEWFGKACDNGNQLGCDNYRKLKTQGL